MRLRTLLNLIAGGSVLLYAADAGAQEHPAKRLSAIVTVAVDEYGKAVDARGRLVSELEYREAVDFLADARTVAARLSGDRAEQARGLLDSLVSGVNRRLAPDVILAIHARFTRALGAEAALDLPARVPDLAVGRRVYEASCASCHGALGGGDGPAAAGMEPAPPAIGTAAAMHDVSPALAYRIIAVGIKGTPMAGWAERLTVEERWDVVAYLTALRASDAHRREGEGLFLQNCASCHGALGAGDGPLADFLTRLPPELSSFAWQAERSDAQLAKTIRSGIPGTAMPAERELADSALAKMVAYVRTLPMRVGSTAFTRSAPRDADDASRTVLATLDASLAATRAGRQADAGDRAFDAYIAFEPIESPARAKNPGLVASMERHFAEFKGAVRAGDVRAAERSRDAIAAGLPRVVELTRPTAGAMGAFFQSLLIVLREGFEAILVVGAIVAFLLQTGHRQRLRAIWIGVGAALAVSAATAVILATVLRAMPATREVIEGVTLLIAVVVLFSVSYWLISKVEAARWQQFIREKVNVALEHGGGRALAVVAFLAVYREGAETALFYQALFAEGSHVVVPVLLGILVGGAVLAVVFTGFYRYGVRIPMRPFFAVTSGLLYWMAFVFMGKGIRELQEGDVLPITVLPGFPHVDAIGLFPSVETLLAQLVLVTAFAFALAKTFWPKRSISLPTVSSEPGAAVTVAQQLAELRESAARLQSRVSMLEDRLAAEGARETSRV